MCLSAENMISIYGGVDIFRSEAFVAVKMVPDVVSGWSLCPATTKLAGLANRVIKYVEQTVENLLSDNTKTISNFYNLLENNDISITFSSNKDMNEREEHLVLADLEGCERWEKESRRAAFDRYRCLLDFDISEELRTKIRSLRTDLSRLSEERQEVLDGKKESEALLRGLQRMFRCNLDRAKDFLDSIQGAEPSEVVNVANQCWEDGLLSGWVKPKDLWRLLYENGLYSPSYQNWSKACKIKTTSK